MVYMRISIFCLACLFFISSLRAQDERFFRKLFSGEFIDKQKIEEAKQYSYQIHTPEYVLDLNNDGTNEAVVFVRRDGDDWIDVFNTFHEKVFSYKFEAKGANAGVYKLIKKNLSAETTALMIFYYEGELRYVNYESSARVYILTIDRKDLKTASMFKGPTIFEEVKTFKNHYHLKNYLTKLTDLNFDGDKDLIVKFNGMSRVFKYNGDGKWQTFRN